MVALAFWTGVLLAATVWPSLSGIIIASLALVAVQRWVRPLRNIAHLPIVVAFVITGATIWTLHHSGLPGDALQRFVLGRTPESELVLRGRVEQPDIRLETDDYSQFILRVTEVVADNSTYSMTGGVLVRWSDPNRPLIHGESVVVHGVVQATIHRVNHGVRGVEHHYRLNGVHTSLRIRGGTAVQTTGEASWWSFRAMASRARQNLAQRLEGVIPTEALPFTLTVWLGDRHRISNNTYTMFLESGTAHILAVSGVHIGLIYLSLTYGLRMVVRRRRLRIVITLMVITLFAFMAGARISSLRAAIMIGLYLSAEWFEREPDAPTALSLAALIFGIQNPTVIFMPGFQLSFLSIASLLLFREPIAGRLSAWPRWLREGVSSVIAVQALTVPAAIIAFHVMPIGGILANLIVIPLLSIVLWLSALTSITSVLIPPLSIWFGHALAPIVMLIEHIATMVASFRFSHLYLTSPSALALLGYGMVVTGALTAIYTRRMRQHAKWIMPVGLVIIVVFWRPFGVDANVTFLDVGHGDSAVIQTASNEVWLVDGGVQDDFRDMGKQVVAPYLWSHHISKLEGIFVSHTDRDHLGGLPYIVDHFEVKQVFVPPGFEHHELGGPFLEQCREKGVRINEVASGDRVRSGSVDIRILHPSAEDIPALSTNDRSLVFTLEADGVSYLFTGDIEAKAEAMIADANTVTVDVIKVPHHGSRTSSTETFLDAVDADVAVVSSGLRGNRALARPEVLERYRDREMRVVRTDYGGSVRVDLGESGISITQARELNNFAFRQPE
ncbi:MAG: DNA internalization-related competence protein ComEC/Rec2 [Candidatus Hydrogenedentota bacterium]